MKKSVALLAGLCFLVSVSAMEIDRVEPPFWWTGMKNPSLQLLVHGKDIGDAKVSLKSRLMAISMGAFPSIRCLDALQ